ncbi:LytR/AlgR family response regulator transcription factor [Hyphobacterium sp.]|uniref:LytR/AlgR family response regulator transcription factor n=1 Tax=Hyphobacterium sp. TaxID=2004662 RepID=UPI003749076A
MTPSDISSVLIIEDEPLIAQRLGRMCEEILPPGCQIEFATDTVAALGWLDTHTADVIFLDLNLKGEDGFDLIRHLSSYAAQTIVVSANTDRAIEAFEFGVVDFVPKPFSKQRLSTAIDRLALTLPPGQTALKYVSFRVAGKVRTYRVEDILSISADDKYSQITMVDGETLFHDKALGAFEQRLPDRFMRVHKSHIVNLDRIAAFRSAPGSRYLIDLDGGSSVPVSRLQAPVLRKIIA